MKNESKKFKIIIYSCVGLFLLIGVVYPVIAVICNIDVSGFFALFHENVFKESLKNSIVVTTISTILSVIVAYILAFAINRSNIKFKKLISIIITLPMLIPSISHGLGLINLFGTNGILTKLLGIDFNIMGKSGIIIGSILYSFPVAFLLLSDAFNYIDNTLYDCAKVIGMNKFQTFKKITFYYMKKPLLSTIFAVFTLIFTDYGVPIAIGGRYQTLPVFLYREVIGLLDFSKGAMIGAILLIPAFVSFIFDLITKEDSSSNDASKEYKIPENKIRDILLYIFIGLIILFLLALFGSFLYLAFLENFPYDKSFSLVHFKYVFNNRVLKFLFNSILISICVSIIGSTFAYLSAYITSRLDGKVNKIYHFISIISLAIPGIFLGLSYIFAFNNTFIYHTFIILILVNIIHFFSSPYLMAYNALGKLNNKFEVVGLTCGVKRSRILIDVLIPSSINTILEMMSYFFVNSMITISAVSFLFNTKIMPVSLLINQYEGQLMYEESAIISIFILLINLLFKVIISIVKKIINNRGGVNEIKY